MKIYIFHYQTSDKQSEESSDAGRVREKNMGWKQGRKSLKRKGHKLLDGDSSLQQFVEKSTIQCKQQFSQE